MLDVPRGAGFGLYISTDGTNRPTTTTGVAVTPSTTSMASATVAPMGSALPEDAHAIEVRISNTGADSASREIATEIMVSYDGGSSWLTLIPGLLCGGTMSYAAGARIYDFPIFIAAGALLGARAYGSVTTALRVMAITAHRPLHQELRRAGHIVEAVGLSGRVGTTIVPGDTSEGARTLIGTTTVPLWHWQMGLQLVAGDTSWVNAVMHFDVEYGDGTNFHQILLDVPWVTNSGEALFSWPRTNELHLPAGSAVYARGQTSGTLDSYTAVVYGVGG